MSYIKRSERAPFALPYLLTLLPFLTRKVSQASKLSKLSKLSKVMTLGLSLLTLLGGVQRGVSLCLPTVSASPVNTSTLSGWPDEDPLLDAPPATPTARLVLKRGERVPLGLVVATEVGAYFGVSSSFKTNDLSTLYGGTHSRFGLSLGARLPRKLELALGLNLGFGETYKRREFQHALDLFSELSLSYFGLTLGDATFAPKVGGLLALYDVEVEQSSVSQVAYGLSAGLKLAYLLSPTNELYLDFTWSPIYNTTAFYLRDPTDEEREENPEAYKYKVNGERGHLFLISVGYRLFGF